MSALPDALRAYEMALAAGSSTVILGALFADVVAAHGAYVDSRRAEVSATKCTCLWSSYPFVRVVNDPGCPARALHESHPQVQEEAA